MDCPGGSKRFAVKKIWLLLMTKCDPHQIGGVLPPGLVVARDVKKTLTGCWLRRPAAIPVAETARRPGVPADSGHDCRVECAGAVQGRAGHPRLAFRQNRRLKSNCTTGLFLGDFKLGVQVRVLYERHTGCALSSVVEHYLHTVGVAGSKPAARTIPPLLPDRDRL